MFDLNGKAALVTGASGGIGGAIARVLHGAGAKVLLHGTRRAALTATVISYRPRSALRDLGKVFGLDAVQAHALARVMQWWDQGISPQRLKEAGFDPGTPKLRQILELAQQLAGFPRHLSQHVGGFVISAGPLSQLVPVENATMPARTVVQWNKDDLEDLGLLKVDVLALGMLTALRRASSASQGLALLLMSPEFQRR